MKKLSEEPVLRMAGCVDCGRSYGEPGFPDLCLPDDAWNAISPSGGHGGLLCPSCICARLERAGLQNVKGYWGSGPLAEKPASQIEHALAALRWWRDEASRRQVEIEVLKALVGEMADNPWDSCEVGSLTCRFCGSYVLTGALVHTANCPITRAQELGVLPKE